MDNLPAASLDPRGGTALTRTHFSRAEINLDLSDKDIENSARYIEKRKELSDIVLYGINDPVNDLSRTLDIIDRLGKITHITAIRLRSLRLVKAPSAFTRPLMNSLADRNCLGVTKPRRIEIEIELLHSSQLIPEHLRIIRELRMRGITVYNNTPLLGFINDNEREMLSISYACRDTGIEFNNVILTGAPVQRDWNEENPIDLNGIIDIATHVRRYGSGREVPRYILRTELGETDFSIAPNIFSLDSSNRVMASLSPCTLEYYRCINPGFQWPEDISFDDGRHPVVYLRGILPGSIPVFRKPGE